MHVVTHFNVHDSAFLDLGFWILAFLQSPDCPGTQSPDNVCGMFERVSAASGGGFLSSIAVAGMVPDNITAAAAADAMKILVVGDGAIGVLRVLAAICGCW
ncbi:hypothetical protein R6Q59_022718 [Mikania micrantha]